MNPKANLAGEDKENAGEYIISADPSRYVTLPVQNEPIWNLYQTTLEKFWTVYDIYVADDKKSFDNNLTPEQRDYILQMLAFMFTSHYTVINKNLFMQLMSQVDLKEASYYFGSQADSKKTHSMMYSMLLDEILQNQAKKEELISGVIQLPHVRQFLHWSLLSLNSNTKTFAQRLLTFATLQGIVFAGTYALFGWFHQQHHQLMPGLFNSNKKIWSDERLNLSFSCMIFDHIDHSLSDEEIHKIVKESVNHSKNLFTKTMPVSKLGLDCRLMEQFIEHSADKILHDLRMTKLYNVECPFDWIEEPEITNSMFNSSKLNHSVVAASYNNVEFNMGDDF